MLVHCQSGARAAVAAAFLHRIGRDVKYVNDAVDDYLRKTRDVEQPSQG